ncbi:MAG: hypothetical protein HGA19_15410 [Oscillochloris sp.]|nr:hypothetical protein [Oscillochloris sp.]
MKLILAFLLVAAIAIAIVSIIQAKQVSDALIDDSGKFLHARTEVEAHLIGNLLDTQITRLRGIAISTNLRQEVIRQNKSYLDRAAIQEQINLNDTRWKTADATDPLIMRVVDNPLSTELRNQARLDQQITEMILTDQYGALVAASAITSDYGQADEE